MLVRLRPLALMIGLPLSLAACAAPTAPAAPVGEMRVLVKLVRGDAEPAGIAALAAGSSGHPARYLADAGSGWHALALACAGPHDCDEALQRLAADPAHFAAAQRDGRKSIVSP